MATFEVPTESGEAVAPYRIDVHFEGVLYQLHFAFNERAGCWFVDIYNENDVLLSGSQPVRNNWPMFSRHKALSGFPPGDLMPIADSNAGLDALITELGVRVKLTYSESA